MLTTLFCPDCKKLLNPAWARCPACDWPRPQGDALPQPGEPLWRAHLDFGVRGVLIYNDLVIFWGGERRGAGGVVALERVSGEPSWTYTVPQAVEGGVTCHEGRLYFGTIGFLGAGGALICLDAASGEEVWRRELPAGLWSRPLIAEGRGLAGLDDGNLVCFDTPSGEPVPLESLGLRAGRLWLLEVDHQVAALSRSGEIMAFDPRWLRPLWPRPIDVEAEITAPPCAEGNEVFFGLSDGRLGRLDLRARRWEVFAEGLGGLRAPLVLAGDRLLAGGRDHHLHAFDRRTGLQVWQSEAFAHSIVTAPAVADDLVVTAVNGGEVACLELAGGEVAWRYTLPIERGLMADPLLVDGVVYAASDAGEAVALPWHLGRYEWAGAWSEAAGDPLNAGMYYALAALQVSNHKQAEFRHRAIENWLESEHPEWAAYLMDNEITTLPEQVAEAYKQAGVILAQRDPRLAVDCLLEAVNWYMEDDQYNQAGECRRMVSRLTRGPHLHITPVNVPTRWQEEVTFTTVVEVENLGKTPARNVWVRFSGALQSRVWVNFDHLNCQQKVEVEVPLSAHQPGNLVVEARYQDVRGQEFSTSRRFEIREVVPFEGVLIDKDAMVGILTLDELPKKVIIRGDVGAIKIKADPLTRIAKAAAAFTWPESTPGLPGEPQTLMCVETIDEERYTVLAGHWAVFLADEAAIATVAPGRYERKKFPPLRGGFSAPRPVWKAVIFIATPFRLAYRMAPFRTREGVLVGVECGLTARFNQTRPFDAWRGILGEKQVLTTENLAKWLDKQVRSTLMQWVAKTSEAELSPAFDHRERVMLSLLERLRETTTRYGVELVEPMYYLNFINPQREQVDNLRAAVYWKDEIERAGEDDRPALQGLVCPHCRALNDADACYCTTCSARLDGENAEGGL